MEYLNLEDVCLLNMGQSPDSSTYNENGEGLPFYQGNADFGEKYPRCRVWCTNPTKIAEKEDILISVRAPIGALNEANEKCCIGRGLASIRPKGQITKDYLFYFLLSKKQYLISKGTGTTFKAISKNILKRLSIPILSLSEQGKQAGSLNHLWDIIQKRRFQLAKLDELVKCRFVEMFGEHESWSKHDTIDLGSICNMISGGTPSSKHPEYFGGSIPFVSSPCLGPNYIDSSAAQNWLTELGVENSSTHIVPKYSLMVGNRVSVGKCSINTCAMCTNQDILSFVGIDTEKYDLLFVKKVIEQYEQFFETQKRGATIKGIPSEFVKASRIPLVSINIQREFASFVRRVDKLRFVIQKSLDETQMLFDSLMQDYFD